MSRRCRLKVILKVISGLSVVLLILWMCGQLVGLGLGTLWRRRCSRRSFRNRLRRNGLPDDVVETIASRYHPPGLIRDVIRSAEVARANG